MAVPRIEEYNDVGMKKSNLNGPLIRTSVFENCVFRFRKIQLFSFVLIFIFSKAVSGAEETALDKSLAPTDESAFANVFKDMGVVQRRAMNKSGKFLITTYGGLDFSDGPYSMYSINTNVGYGISDFFEIYLNIVPMFVTNPRSIVGLIQGLKLDPAEYPTTCRAGVVCTATVSFIKPKMQFGGEILWAPAYGKDSIGSRSVIRSDTFFKLGVASVIYEESQKGLSFNASVGKTYFLDEWVGFRIAASALLKQTYYSVDPTVLPTKAFRFYGVVEAGIILYL